MAKIVVTGIKQLDRSLQSLGTKVANKIARKSMRKIGKLVKAAAERKLAANDSVESGKLRRGLRIKAMKRSRGRLGIQVETTVGKHEDPGFGGAEVEFGTKRSQTKPFLRPAIYDNEDIIRGAVIADIVETINEVARTGRLYGKRF